MAVPAWLAGCERPSSSTGAPSEGDAVSLEVWSQTNPTDLWRTRGPEMVASKIDEWDVTVKGVNHAAEWEDYKRKVTLAADAGKSPHVVVSGHEDVAPWSEAGYIVPIDDYMEQYPQFDGVIDSVWQTAEYNGKTWGLPSETEARPMFFHKRKLAELGWSQAEIDGLPDKIKDGEFKLDDMINTARQAVDEGVVKEGFGYYHRPEIGWDFLQYYIGYGGRMYDEESGKLILTRDALVDFYEFQRTVVDERVTAENVIGIGWEQWHDTVSHGNTLFWNGGIWNWAEWSDIYAKELGGEPYLWSFIGFGLQPTGSGDRGVTLSHPLLYMIASEEASGDAFQDPAGALVAETADVEIMTKHDLKSAHIGILEEQYDYPPYKRDRFLSSVSYMVDYAVYQPNHLSFGPWFEAIYNNMVSAESGDLSPEQAADEAVALMKAEIPDDVTFE
ncbi:MAG: sugar ABC transporter substrate-binding protein [Actinomycetota bacterium]